jgi:hypothetical protein
MEVDGIPIVSTEEEVSTNVKASWNRGQTAMVVLRAELGDDADDLAPMVKFWVQFDSDYSFKKI